MTDRNAAPCVPRWALSGVAMLLTLGTVAWWLERDHSESFAGGGPRSVSPSSRPVVATPRPSTRADLGDEQGEPNHTVPSAPSRDGLDARSYRAAVRAAFDGVRLKEIEVDTEQVPFLASVVGDNGGELSLSAAAEAERAVQHAAGFAWCGVMAPLGGDLVVSIECYLPRSATRLDEEVARERVNRLLARARQHYAPASRGQGEGCEADGECASFACVDAVWLEGCSSARCCADRCEFETSRSTCPRGLVCTRTLAEGTSTSGTRHHQADDEHGLSVSLMAEVAGHLNARGLCVLPSASAQTQATE